MHFTNTVVIDRPPAEVFAYLADPENIPAWNYAIAESHAVDPGPIHVGTVIRQRRTLPRPADEELVVAEFDPDRLLTLRGDLGPLHGTISYQLEPVGSGTRLINEADMAARGPLAIVAGLAAGRVGSAVAANLDALKRILEAQPG